MLKQVFTQQNLNNMIQGVLTDPAGTVDTLLKPFKDLFNANPQYDELEPLEEKKPA